MFRPRFYQKHRELACFEPWTYRVWKGRSPGIAHGGPTATASVNKTLDSLVDVFAEKKLPDFGYKYSRLDAGYAIGSGGAEVTS